MQTCKEYTDKLDIMRKESLKDIFPYFDSSVDFITPTLEDNIEKII